MVKIKDNKTAIITAIIFLAAFFAVLNGIGRGVENIYVDFAGAVYRLF